MSDSTIEESTGAVETVEEIGKQPADIVTRWLMEVSLATKIKKDWLKDATRIKKRYRHENKGKNKFNILWSNTETLRPALFNSTPKPDVRRRFRDEDPVGMQIAEVGEKALSFSVDDSDLEGVIEKVVLDHLLVGRGLARVRYVPSFKQEKDKIDINSIEDLPEGKTEDDIQQEGGRRFIFGDDIDVIAFEEVQVELVRWDRWDHGPGSTWKDVQWEKFDHLLTRDQLVKAFGEEIGNAVSLNRDMVKDEDSQEENTKDSESSPFKRAAVWEIWDKEERKIIWIAPHHKTGPLLTEDDPLGLNDFYPNPEPLYSIDDTDNLIPIPEFLQYEDQALELDQITNRINKLVKGLKARGLYDSTIKSVEKLETANDNEMIAAGDVTALIDRGGLKNAIWMYPIDTIAQVLTSLYIQRDQIKATIFEITGISDIQRGVSDPNETAKAQSIKSRFGSLRLKRRQKNVAKLVRNIIRLMAEIMMEKFQPRTIQLMTGVQITPEMAEIMQRDGVREYRIDIETDSTVAEQQEADEANITKLLGGLGQFLNAIIPAVQSGAISQGASMAIMLGAVRKFKFGRQVEDALLKDAENAKKEGDDPNKKTPEQMEAEKAKAEADAQFQLDMEKAKNEGRIKEAKAGQDMKLQVEKAQLESKLAQEKNNQEIRLKRELAGFDVQMKREEQEAGRKLISFPQDQEDRLTRIEEDMNDIGQAMIQLSQAIVQGNQIAQQNNQILQKLLTAPRKMIRDEKGRPDGIQIVLQETQPAGAGEAI